ncbi:uncharacterized protein C19orf47-like [Haliotis rufescens]|uniref:uncharacterized protein C19orf47-like n=1 Tax=Haliotis rufescens TaxID=6454 RepID=UPI00201F9CBB|nr:uncharacterized protein C19orf47-like [Haliotis rufescens]
MASSMSSSTENSTSYWIKFFTDAGVPPGDSANYAVAFNDNRIQRDMLLDLSKEYLLDMGISRLGDVIAILKHAKAVHTQDARDKVLKNASPAVTQSTSNNSPSQPRRSTAAARMVGHYLGKDPEAAPMKNIPTPKPEVSDSLSKRSSVFERLGVDSPQQVTVTGLGNVVLKSASPSGSVFNRLGDKSTVKRPASSTSVLGEDEDDSDDVIESVLEYAGVLKSPPKKVKVTSMSKKAAALSAAARKLAVRKKITIQTAEVTTTSPASASTAGILSRDYVAENLSIKQRLGKKVQTEIASSTTTSSSTTSPVTPSVTVRLGPQKATVTSSSGLTSHGIKSRLGPKTGEDTPVKQPVTISSTPTVVRTGIFGRLGRKHTTP